jgi:hypothetical protein
VLWNTLSFSFFQLGSPEVRYPKFLFLSWILRFVFPHLQGDSVEYDCPWLLVLLEAGGFKRAPSESPTYSHCEY